jgi:hypothetical protein
MLRKTVFLTMVLFSTSSLMAFGLGSVKSAATGDDPGTKAAEKSFVAAVTNLSKAQVKFSEALGLKKEAEKAQSVVNSLGKGSLDGSTVKDAVSKTDATNKAIGKAMEKSEPLSAASKAKFVEGIGIYATGMVNTGTLVKQAKDIRGIGTGLAIAKGAPTLLSSVSSTSGQVISFAQKNNVDASKMSSALGSL